MSDRFPRLRSQEEINDLERLEKRRRRAERIERTAFLGGLLLMEITVIVWIAAQHPAWPL